MLRFRQIHLDFHTSPGIPDVAADFDAEEFAATLNRARVDSVTAFARCHHGFVYYDSHVNPERVHPHLRNRNLLPEQIEACHRRGIRVPIYVTVQWDDYTADEHRDWIMVDEKGVEFGTAPLAPGFYRFLDVFHPGYREFLYNHVREILTAMPVDGLFFDIVQNRPSLARHWLDAMDREGFDPESEGDRQRFAMKVHNDWQVEMTEFIRQYSKDCTIFYNSGHVGPRHRPIRDAYTHFELESLPSGGWGYLHFPQAMRYARTLGKDCMGMTGKFHTSWGDFSSFKSPQALQFECFNMLALGAKCSIGDQLHPSGRIDRDTYDLIGSVYREVERKESWCRAAEPVAEIAILTPEEFVLQRAAFNAKSDRDVPAVMGAIRILQELRHQFDIVDTAADFARYRLLVLPDDVPVSDTLKQKIDGYLAGGGSLIASHRSGLSMEGDRFTLDALGVALVGDAPYSPDFLVPGEIVGKWLRPTAHVMYRKALEVKPAEGTEILAQVEVPYFNRTWRHFCSHRHTPSAGKIAYPGIVRRGNTVYFAHPVFTQYYENAPLWCKRFVADAISLFLPEPVVRVEGPSTLQAALNEQRAENRRVLHLLHYIPERRGQAFDVIEDIIPLYNVRASIETERHVRHVRLVPEGDDIPFERNGGRVEFVVPEISGHAMVEIGY